MTLQQLLSEGTEELRSAGVPEAALDARRILLEAFRMDEVHFLLERTREMGVSPDRIRAEGAAFSKTEACKQDAAEDYRRMIRRRAEREPLQYILGHQEFMGLDFIVNRHVLIPRQDTETLVELVLREQQDRQKKVLDLCTGSGCIAVSLAARGGYASVTATDLSAEALKIAEENGRRLLEGWKIEPDAGTAEAGQTAADGRRFFLQQGDLFDALPYGERYDILVSNPPYIPSKVIEELQPEVRDYEPVTALDGSADGLEFYRRIAKEAGKRLNPGGAVYLEIGYDQGDAVSRILSGRGFREIEVFRDLAGQNRAVRARI